MVQRGWKNKLQTGKEEYIFILKRFRNDLGISDGEETDYSSTNYQLGKAVQKLQLSLRFCTVWAPWLIL